MNIDYNVQDVFSERLKYLIQEKGLSVSKVAEKVGIPNSTISDWLHKKKIPLIIQMPKLAFFFNVTIDYLLGYED